MDYPERIKVKKRNYKLVKVYKNYALYEDEKGFKECFNLFDLGIVKKYKRKTNDWWNVMPVIL